MRSADDVVADLVVQAMGRADAGRAEKLNKGAALAELLQGAGIDIQAAGVRAWARGDAMPPASSLLEACRLTDVSIDEALYAETLRGQVERLEKRVEEALEGLARARARG